MLILASNSTTRASILRQHNIDFVQVGVDFDESSIKTNCPKTLVYSIAQGKSKRYQSLYGIEKPFLCADTVVVSSGRILEKARDIKEAREMLRLQSANSVEIFTSMIYRSPKLRLEDLSVTSYFFELFDEDEMEVYLSSNEWKDKAGACMVEGFCKSYIRKVVGYESSAKGLCIEKLLPFLEI
ncbi:MAG: septum formation inhibitor Maf [Campylobacteraceae bacterium]|nr:septum formation inhibitor Maf [Campylobacteraceae bacterium]